MEESKTENESENQINEEFTKVICDFAEDLLITFPDIIEKTNNPIKELNCIIKEDSNSYSIDTINSINNLIKSIYTFCKSTFPQYFFYILYENNELFNKEPEVFLLPNINFVDLWNSDISDDTKSTIWNYLKLILFTVVADVNTKDAFGDSAQLFDAINNDEFKKKIAESLSEMENIFKKKSGKSGKSGEKKTEGAEGADGGEGEEGADGEDDDEMELPNAEELHNHINQMMEGKIGSLAKEIAEETAEELDINIADNSSINDVFSKLFKNPTKLLSLVKNVGSKLDTKLKSGEIKESELIQEATEFVANMKNMPGMNNLESLFSKMGIPGMGGMGGKMDMGALNRELAKNLNKAKMKEKMLKKLEKKREHFKSSQPPPQPPTTTEGTIKDLGVNDFGMQELLYSLGEQFEKTKPENKPDTKPENKRNKRNKRKKTKIVNVIPESLTQEE
jgi:hypothetical protein